MTIADGLQTSAIKDAEQDSFLAVRDLVVRFPTEDGLVKSVDGLSFDLQKGRTLAIVGESGSGKSVTSQAIMGLHRGSSAQLSGEILLEGIDLMSLKEDDLRQLRGDRVAMIFQDPLSALHPYYTVGSQIVEAVQAHHRIQKKAARVRVLEMLDLVGIPNPQRRIDQYPHEFSGGMRQRAMIAMALVNDPELLIADEPTTALDVTVQAQILDLMRRLQQEFGTAIIMVTHDLGVVADIADEVLVMYAGKAVETGSVKQIFGVSEHPYTWGLLSSMPRLDRGRRDRLDPIPGNPPSLINVPSGCAFHPRCEFRDHVPNDDCVTLIPSLDDTSSGHGVRCHITPVERRQIFADVIQPRAQGDES